VPAPSAVAMAVLRMLQILKKLFVIVYQLSL
jgi:hypothetical protein